MTGTEAVGIDALRLIVRPEDEEPQSFPHEEEGPLDIWTGGDLGGLQFSWSIPVALLRRLCDEADWVGGEDERPVVGFRMLLDRKQVLGIQAVAAFWRRNG